MANVPLIRLNNGVAIPQLGFGVGRVPPEETQRTVEAALEAGYRHIDTAAAYRNEAGVGAAVRASGLPRQEVFITTKLRNGEQRTARRAFENSLRELGLDYVDLYLIHWPVPAQNLYVHAWHELEQIVDEGLARAVGVANFLPEHLATLLAAADTVPAENQIELHPSLQQHAVAEWSREHGIAVEAYSPLGRGADLAAAAVTALAARHGATPAQIVLAWELAQGYMAIPKTVSRERMAENLAAVDIRLSAEEIEAVTGLEAGNRLGSDPATLNVSQL
ncbi:aldo/keto reductase [Arthrobacter mobilis]|uniref:Aldo/keto reductase n=1 Tax=Arthrobacter mobilis TaxID=2724944 RepID=A0A7X6HCP7_9MICC|nr:aldo/keto reductase [Arthrobacter mobilis]NKX54703.1 aldo/keto reductase [Arthrobacter mobilis]